MRSFRACPLLLVLEVVLLLVVVMRHAVATWSSTSAYRSKSRNALFVCHRQPLIKNLRSAAGMGPLSITDLMSTVNAAASRDAYLVASGANVLIATCS
jgi:hypothetical protein